VKQNQDSATPSHKKLPVHYNEEQTVKQFLLLFSDAFKKQIGFHAVLIQSGQAISLKKDESVKCEHIVYNGGGGYDNKTGVFTVPASGIYCFMATGTPNNSDATLNCWAMMIQDNVLIANLSAFSKGRTTANAVVYAKAGQKVCLRSNKDDSKFLSGWNTSFSGVLICPDV
jgi:hypothetical protein